MTASYMVVDEEPIILLFVRDRDRNRRLMKVRGFRPYFYVKTEDVKYLYSGGRILRFEDGDYWSVHGEKLTKVVCRIPQDVKVLREFLHKRGVLTYESDIKFVLRFLIDKDIYCGVDEHLRPVEIDVPARVLMFDIENATEKRPSLEDEILCIGFYDSYTDEIVILIQECGELPAFNRLTDKKLRIEVVEDERELLERFIDEVATRKPDIIAGYNIVGYDLPNLVARCRKLKVDYRRLSPLRAVKKRDETWRILGVEVFDFFPAILELYAREFRRYSLDEMVRELLGIEEKVEIGNFKRMWSIRPELVIQRNIYHVEKMVLLEEKIGIIEFYENIRKLVGARLQDIYPHRKASFCEMLILRKTRDLVKLRAKLEYEESTYTGAIVLEPKVGLWRNVAVIDFSALYPSIMRAYNISFETYNPKGRLRIDEENAFVDSPRGIIPQLLDRLIELRAEYKKKRKEARDPIEYMKWDAKQKAVKYITNSLYGYFGFPASRLYSPKIAECITSAGLSIFF